MKNTLKFAIMFSLLSSINSYAADLNTACEMFLHSDFKGNKYLVYAGAKISFVGNPWNDQISSLKVPAGCQLHVYQHGDFKGFDKSFTPGSHKYVGNAWNDQISSVKCLCK